MSHARPRRGQPAALTGEYSGAVGDVLHRVQAAYPRYIDLSLDRLNVLLGKLGNPEKALPPVIHVAGTNGKGSTCAFLRAMAEAAGLGAHVMTSPHLVSVSERFSIGGAPVPEDLLANTLREVEAINDGAPITVFETLTAAGFLLFARAPADLAIIEVGLGGRLDATNVIASPLISAITPIGLDHQAFLGDTLAGIAAEKAGIIKTGRPIVSARQSDSAASVISAIAKREQSVLWQIGQEVNFTIQPDGGMEYQDPSGTLTLPRPALLGRHQYDNAALAVAAIRLSASPLFSGQTWEGLRNAHWPGRLQNLSGKLLEAIPPGWELWLDGGHNPHAGEALRETFALWQDRPLHLLIGMKSSKDIGGFIRPLLPFATSVYAVREADQFDAVSVEEILAASQGFAQAGPDVRTALAKLDGPPGRVLICGSLYLAGTVLKLDGAPS